MEKSAYLLDPTDFVPIYHIAHCCAILRQINEAMEHVQKALKLRPDDKESLHLFALLLTAKKNYDEAHTVMCKACALYDDFEYAFVTECLNALICQRLTKHNNNNK